MNPHEAAVMSAKLYEFEKLQSDAYVEKKLLNKKIQDMEAQVRFLWRAFSLSNLNECFRNYLRS